MNDCKGSISVGRDRQKPAKSGLSNESRKLGAIQLSTAQTVLSQTHRLEEPAWKRDVQTAVWRIASLFYPNAALAPFDVAAPQEIQGSISRL